jgi:maleylpyruvate isomerase
MSTPERAVEADLTLARRGTDYYDGLLRDLLDDDFDGPSLLPGRRRRHVVAHVGFNARALARLVRWGATGVETPMYASVQARNDEIDQGATRSPAALRELHRVESDALETAWRLLPADRWVFPVRTAQGRTVPVSTTPWMRVREVWLHAVDLGTGGRFEDFPPELIDRLLLDITSWWARAGEGAELTLAPTDRAVTGLPATGTVTIRGTAAHLARWAAGRGTDGVSSSAGDAVVAPRWL